MRWVFVIALHLLLGGVLVNGTHISNLQIRHSPMQTVLIHDVKLEPPPAAPPVKRQPPAYVPPPDVPAAHPESAAAITASTQPTPEKIEAPVVSMVTAPPTPAVPEKVSAALICPNQVPPEIPRKALLDNIQGLVQAQAVVLDGHIKDVRILSGPRVFHEAVKAAMQQYKCSVHPSPVVAMQSFNFRFE
jgi:protein TonB